MSTCRENSGEGNTNIKRKREYDTDERNQFNHESWRQPLQKRQKTTENIERQNTFHNDSNISSQTSNSTQSTVSFTSSNSYSITNNINDDDDEDNYNFLNNPDLFGELDYNKPYLSPSNEPDDDEECESIDSENDINLNQTYKTPEANTKFFNNLSIKHIPNRGPTNNHNLSTISISPVPMNTDRDISATASAAAASIYGLSENELSVLFGYLTLNEILQISKTCTVFWNQSFKLISRLTIRCKSIYGVNHKQINRLLSRCSFYLKYLDLTNVASVITDSTLKKISNHCNQITFASFHGCISITDEGLITFLTNCHWIKELDISGCTQITSSIGPSLSKCVNLRSLNMAWCTEINANIVPYLIYLNQNHGLRHLNIHSCNKYVTFYPSFECCIQSIEKKINRSFRLKNKLCIIGGLQKKTLNEDTFNTHISYLQSKNIEYTDPESINLRSISEYDFKYKLDLLLQSKHISSEIYKYKYNRNENINILNRKQAVYKSGYRLYSMNKTNKIYMVIITEFGVFGTKLLPDEDFQPPRDSYMAVLQRSDKNPIDYLKNECNLSNWEWIDEFQSKRTLSLLGMNKNANWIKLTAIKKCEKINTFINTKK